MKETLSRYEWAIMEVLWNHHPLYMSEIMESMQTTVDWNRSSFQTYMKRMIDRGYIGYDTIKGNRSYYPILQREDCIESESNAMLGKLTEQSAKLFLASMIQKSGLNDADRRELQELISNLGNDSGQE